MSASIEDVAARAGVSTATVSRALRGLPNVSAATRERVLAVAREMDYVVSPSASSLASGRTSTVAVVGPYITRWFFGQCISGAEEVLRDSGYDLLLYNVSTPASRARFFATLPLRRRVDAVLVIGLPMDAAELTALRSLNVPLSFVHAAPAGYPSVRIDDVAGGFMAGTHLVNLGHERIGMIGGGGEETTHFTVPVDRAAGFASALAKAGLPALEDLRVDGSFTITGGERAMAQLLSTDRPPTAVFALSDEMAFGAMRAISRAGLRCPQDISLMGFDDHEMAVMLDLTTIAQPVPEQGARAAAAILRTLADPDAEPVQELAPIHIVIRGSTAPPRPDIVGGRPQTGASRVVSSA